MAESPRRDGCCFDSVVSDFATLDAETVAAIEAIKDVDRLETLGERILDPEIHDWAWRDCKRHEPRSTFPANGRLDWTRRSLPTEIRRAVSDAQPPGPSEARSSSVFHLPPPKTNLKMIWWCPKQIEKAP